MNHVLDDYIFNNYVVIGVSAGPDSMCLLDLLQKENNKNSSMSYKSQRKKRKYRRRRIYYQILSR